MGGPGSGRPRQLRRKQTVDDAYSFDISWLTEEGYFADENGRYTGAFAWPVYGPDLLLRTDFKLNVARRWIRLIYHHSPSTDLVTYKVRLTTTTVFGGGVRWWFICPMKRKGELCGRRVGSLFLPAGRRYFVCRHCHGLTYRSCQESHKHGSHVRADGA